MKSISNQRMLGSDSFHQRSVTLNWQGTGKLTRKTSPVATGRVLVLGDASGYVEPFTGEGMGWGLSSAVACVPISARHGATSRSEARRSRPTTVVVTAAR